MLLFDRFTFLWGLLCTRSSHVPFYVIPTPIPRGWNYYPHFGTGENRGSERLVPPGSAQQTAEVQSRLAGVMSSPAASMWT